MPDPKDKVEVYKAVLKALRSANQRGGTERLAQLEQILKESPDAPMILTSVGESYFRAEKFEEALEAFRKVLALRPGDAKVLYLAAYCTLQKGDPTGAIEGFKQVLLMDPTHHDAAINLGVALIRTNHLDEAVDQFKKTLQLHPDDPQAHKSLAYALLKNGMVEEALKELHTALRLDPEFAEAYLWLGFCHLEVATRHQRADTRHPQIPVLMGQAREAFRKAISLDSSLTAKVPASLRN